VPVKPPRRGLVKETELGSDVSRPLIPRVLPLYCWRKLGEKSELLPRALVNTLASHAGLVTLPNWTWPKSPCSPTQAEREKNGSCEGVGPKRPFAPESTRTKDSS